MQRVSCIVDATPFKLPHYPIGTRDYSFFYAKHYKSHCWKFLGNTFFLYSPLEIQINCPPGVTPLYGNDLAFIYFSRRGSAGSTSEQQMWIDSGVPILLRQGRMIGPNFYSELALGDRLYEGNNLLSIRFLFLRLSLVLGRWS